MPSALLSEKLGLPCLQERISGTETSFICAYIGK